MKRWLALLPALAILSSCGFRESTSRIDAGASLSGSPVRVTNGAGHSETNGKPGTVEKPGRSTGQTVGAEQASEWKTLELTEEMTHLGELVLVNRDRELWPEAVPGDIVDLGEREDLTSGYSLLDPSIELSEQVALRFGEMVEAASSDGVRHFRISSGYRSFDEQEELYEEKGDDYALPAGYSEHNLGLSLDIGSTQGPIDDSAEGSWLKKRAWDYGFVLRYPKDKSSVTGIQYEPWHFRYVGLPHSLIMKKKDFVLEEYLAYLKEKRTIVAEAKGTRYRITYVPVPATDGTAAEVPVNGDYTLSGDNAGGVIVTVSLKEAA
ncbi:M15 family metallopeptidase [Cohnella fermenti]|uniref:D-alanyl-D-alanine carboxypeptidase family protein n=1 Tax=Cohnella fermenti TaxID=2565925 RepID=A0A4S4BHL2_9BACL|nr:M15 family metallopeptidase [Cohnella fermenti]THF74043.1 D-alanyl-D-alanine carboxypeptidase family protein [Cohnella fermenti]